MADQLIIGFLTNLYLDDNVALAGFSIATILGWVVALILKGRGWFHIDFTSIVIINICYILSMLFLLKMIPGFNQILILTAVIFHAVINPYYITTSGMAIGSNISHVSKHRQYRYLNLSCLILMSYGNLLVWFDGKYPPWALMLIILLFMYLVLLVPPRQAIISQQLFYSYKGIIKK